MNGTAPTDWKAQWEEFISVLALEVRSPLSNMNLSLELMASLMESDEQKMYMDIISRNFWKVSGLVNELLHYQPLGEEHRGKYSAQRLLDEASAMAGDLIALKDIVVHKSYSGEDCALSVNAHKMKIALNNIVVNAIESMTTKQRLLTLEARHVEEGYMITIGDTGRGISKEDMPKIFTPYFTDRPGRLGLGLSTAFGILMSDHVQVNVESEEGVGTRVILLFQRPV